MEDITDHPSPGNNDDFGFVISFRIDHSYVFLTITYFFYHTQSKEVSIKHTDILLIYFYVCMVFGMCDVPMLRVGRYRFILTHGREIPLLSLVRYING